jgi:flagellar biogenesis protein FliO
LNPPASSPAAAWVDSAFDSGADSFNESAAQPVAPNPRPSNLLFWFLVMINVLLFVAVIAYLLLDLMQ